MGSEFAVVYTTPADETAIGRLRAAYPSAYELVPGSVYLVRDSALSAEIAAKVGIKSDPRVAVGAVFKLNHAYSGYTDRTLWEWLGE